MSQRKCPKHNFLLNNKGKCVWCQKEAEGTQLVKREQPDFTPADKRFLKSLRIKADDE